MPVAPTIAQFAAVTLSAPHSDGTPSYITSHNAVGYPVYGVAAETAASGSTLDIYGVGSVVTNSGWAFDAGGLPVFVVDVGGTLSTTAPASSAYNIAGWSLSATSMVVCPQAPVDIQRSGAQFILCDSSGVPRTGETNGANLINAKAGIGIGGSTATPVGNGDIVIEATSNTLLTFKLKGSDGTVRTGTLTIA